MNTSSRRRLQGISLFVVFLALGAAILDYQGRSIDRDSGDFFRTSAHEYRDLKFINKAQVSFSSDNADEAQDAINNIMDTYAKQRIRRQSEGNLGAYLFTVHQADLQDVIGELRRVGSVRAYTEQIDTALVNLDFDSESARLASYERELNDLDKVRMPSEQQNARKETLHRLIQTSRNNLDKLRESESVLLYITLSPIQTNAAWQSNALDFIKIFLKWLLILSLIFILVTLGSRLLMYFLSMIGLRDSSGAGADYGYYSGYGDYTRHGKKSRGKRKVKRIYKDKGSPEDKKDSEN
nr:hypothetical protein [Candidatus Cloacimonadota bacterium]